MVLSRFPSTHNTTAEHWLSSPAHLLLCATNCYMGIRRLSRSLLDLLCSDPVVTLFPKKSHTTTSKEAQRVPKERTPDMNQDNTGSLGTHSVRLHGKRRALTEKIKRSHTNFNASSWQLWGQENISTDFICYLNPHTNLSYPCRESVKVCQP
jgi:hypothetical protein